MDRAPGEPGEHDGDVRALRTPGDPPDGGARASLPSERSRTPRRTDQAGTEAAALPPRRGLGGGRGAAHGATGERDAHLDGEGERVAGDPRGATRNSGGSGGPGDPASFTTSPSWSGVLNLARGPWGH